MADWPGLGAGGIPPPTDEAFDALKGPVKRVGAPQIPVPVAPTHEKIFKPGPEDVVLAVREAMGKKGLS